MTPFTTGFMRIRHIIIVSAAIVATILVACCSKPHPTTPPNTTDLGAVELTPQTPTQFNLGAGKVCTLVGRQLTNGIEVELVVLSTNVDGTVDRSQGKIETLPGRQCAISMGDTMVGMTPTLKTP